MGAVLSKSASIIFLKLSVNVTQTYVQRCLYKIKEMCYTNHKYVPKFHLVFLGVFVLKKSILFTCIRSEAILSIN